MNDLPELLFYGNDLHRVLDGNIEIAKKDIDAIPEDQFLSSEDEEIVGHVYSNREVISLELQDEAMEMDTTETQIDVRNDPMRAVFDKSKPCLIPGIKVTVTIPFIGDAALWKCQPSSFTFNPPRANVHSSRNEDAGYIEIFVAHPSDTLDEKEIKSHIDRTVSDIKSYIGNVKKDVDSHNDRLLSHIKQYVAHRRERLGKHSSVAKALNIPLKKKSGAPDITALPIKRRLVRPLTAKSKITPEPGIHDEDYEHILKVIRHEGQSFEATPKTFAKHNEEELRDIILAHLNGHYEGQATGETFRVSGKTDIRIEDKKRAAFIAECKIWRGQAEITKAIDQLLGYLTWRDCKTALIVFNTNIAGFSDIQEKLHAIIQENPRYIMPISIDKPGEWRYKLNSLHDEERQIILHVFLFNLYVKD